MSKDFRKILRQLNEKSDKLPRELDDRISEVYNKNAEYMGALMKIENYLNNDLDNFDNRDVIRELKDLQERVTQLNEDFADKVVNIIDSL